MCFCVKFTKNIPNGAKVAIDCVTDWVTDWMMKWLNDCMIDELGAVTKLNY